MDEREALAAPGQRIGDEIGGRYVRRLPVKGDQVGLWEMSSQDFAADVAGAARQPVAVGVAMAVDATFGVKNQTLGDPFDDQGRAQGAVPVAGGDCSGRKLGRAAVRHASHYQGSGTQAGGLRGLCRHRPDHFAGRDHARQLVHQQVEFVGDKVRPAVSDSPPFLRRKVVARFEGVAVVRDAVHAAQTSNEKVGGVSEVTGPAHHVRAMAGQPQELGQGERGFKVIAQPGGQVGAGSLYLGCLVAGAGIIVHQSRDQRLALRIEQAERARSGGNAQRVDRLRRHLGRHLPQTGNSGLPPTGRRLFGVSRWQIWRDRTRWEGLTRLGDNLPLAILLPREYAYQCPRPLCADVEAQEGNHSPKSRVAGKNSVL